MGVGVLVSLLCVVCLPAALAQYGGYAGYGGCPQCWDKTNELHPMVLFCKAKYALKIRAEQQTGNTFVVSVIKDFKNNLPIHGKFTIYTDCPSYFKVKKTYMILGGSSFGYGGFSLRMEACDFKVLSKDLACTQRTAFGNGGYDCECVDMCVAGKPGEYVPDYQVKCFNSYVLCQKYHRDPSAKCLKFFHHYYRPCLSSRGNGYR
ncbi:uncharacterized protein LOC110441820 isoform X2 [Mizuhopecten yessoensis]|uniref:uncharacterized protein LOC110441820 isoform X2 n=1 Tax=Mizuhopecten yessoensis TaxID=6573 RepID=UPI000B45CDA9|nr:uncharacterized protein LOC110441820 isoform X2 [Mizuhopecten yessoensis]